MNMPWPCFHGCGYDSDCGHREIELVAWVRQVNRDEEANMRDFGLSTLALLSMSGDDRIPNAGLKPTPPVDQTALGGTELPRNVPRPVVARKPFVRAEALKRSGYNVVVSREDALALKRV